MNDLRCPACNHNVVSWCPDDSQFDGDLVCYNCGLHKISTAWKKIEFLQGRVAQLEAERDALAKALRTMGVHPESVLKAYNEETQQETDS